MALTVASFKKAVTTAGTRVQLSSSSIKARAVAIKAGGANTGLTFLGDSSVSSSVGYELAPAAAWTYEDLAGKAAVDEVDLSSIWLDAATNGNFVTVFYLK